MVTAPRLRAWSDGTPLVVAEMGAPLALPTLLSAGDVGAVIVATRNGKVRSMYVRVTQAPGIDESDTYTLVVQGVATSLSATISGAAATEASDLVNQVSVKKGDKLEIMRSYTISAADPLATRVEVEFA